MAVHLRVQLRRTEDAQRAQGQMQRRVHLPICGASGRRFAMSLIATAAAPKTASASSGSRCAGQARFHGVPAGCRTALVRQEAALREHLSRPPLAGSPLVTVGFFVLRAGNTTCLRSQSGHVSPPSCFGGRRRRCVVAISSSRSRGDGYCKAVYTGTIPVGASRRRADRPLIEGLPRRQLRRAITAAAERNASGLAESSPRVRIGPAACRPG
jgi:hypothetical protein